MAGRGIADATAGSGGHALGRAGGGMPASSEIEASEENVNRSLGESRSFEGDRERDRARRLQGVVGGLLRSRYGKTGTERARPLPLGEAGVCFEVERGLECFLLEPTTGSERLREWVEETVVRTLVSVFSMSLPSAASGSRFVRFSLSSGSRFMRLSSRPSCEAATSLYSSCGGGDAERFEVVLTCEFKWRFFPGERRISSSVSPSS